MFASTPFRKYCFHVKGEGWLLFSHQGQIQKDAYGSYNMLFIRSRNTFDWIGASHIDEIKYVVHGTFGVQCSGSHSVGGLVSETADGLNARIRLPSFSWPSGPALDSLTFVVPTPNSDLLCYSGVLYNLSISLWNFHLAGCLVCFD